MDIELRDKLRGKFIVFDGPDGCGKTTQLARLAEALSTSGATVVRARDPGGTKVGDRIRAILLGDDLDHMDPRCETLLFMASRAQLVTEVIAPALRAGQTVLCDRFISSTCAYQGALGLDVDRVIRLGTEAVGETWPDLTCVLDLSAEAGLRRARHRAERANDGSTADAMEARPLDFHRRVQELFCGLPGVYPKPVVVVEADGSIDEVFMRVIEALRHADL
ncbi:MAG: dTMP kinase [Phycisphaerae bacterium]|nr:dTMP kinase [Phycisphaerae bacterium]